MNGSRLQAVGTALTALLGALISETGVGLDFVEETDAAWYIVVLPR